MTDRAGEAGAEGAPGADSVRGLAQRLRHLAEQLRDPELADERAAELAREAAELVSQAGNEIDRTLREGESGPA
jgi:methyl-accepting chemotaxis protein